MSADLERALGAPVARCSVATTLLAPLSKFDTTAEAMAFARSACGPMVPQVSVVAWSEAQWGWGFAQCVVFWNSSTLRVDTSVWAVFVDGSAAGTVEQALPLIGDGLVTS